MKGKIQQNEIQPDLFDAVYAEMYCDGASSGNPGPSGIGVVINIASRDKRLTGKDGSHRISEYIGIATNNVAEYSALLKGLETAMSLGIKNIKIFMDSELMARQINGIYRVKNEKLIPLWTRAMKILREFSHYDVSHIPREMNMEADSLARRAVSAGREK
ncbi:MAG: ribonuclease HI family protein [Nitrospirae bacterium]|nr:ribonuclease HI family protein [Nitrospirota bacterium]